MKRLVLLLAFIGFLSQINAQLRMDYYFPSGTLFNESVPTPEEVLGFVPGEWHMSHDQTIRYFERLAAGSDRVVLQEYGRSYQNRPLFHIIITSPENHKNLEAIRLNHISLADPTISHNVNIANMPAVIRLGYGVHGNEASAQNAAPLVAYFYAAAQGEKINNILKNTVILLDPGMNPDGQQRFASWVNMHKSKNPVTDPENREFREVWPGSRTNHYWFDLNRDWMLAQHPESKGRLAFYHQWKPLINTDHHEFGANSTFFFQPGIPTRTNPITPRRTNELTYAIGKFHASALDAIGALYFTGEIFDDFYYGKGSTYPDVNGSVGILFEQGGMKGHRRETRHGIIDFAFTIKNQVVVSFSTVEAAINLRKELLDNLRGFYLSAIDLAIKDNTKAWIFGEPHDEGKMAHFLELLKINDIRVYSINSPVSLENKSFEPAYSYIVPLNQPQYRLIQSMFQAVTSFDDSLFYDTSTWIMPMAFNIPYAAVTNQRQVENLKGKKVETVVFPTGKMIGQQSNIGYVFKWEEYYSPRMLYMVQSAGLRTSVATSEFKLHTQGGLTDFSFGSIFVMTDNQELSSGDIYSTLKRLAELNGIDVYSVSTGLTKAGINIGSENFLSLDKPEILMIVGDGISSGESGEIWHLLDQRFDMPVTKVEISRFNNLELTRYNTIILPGGSYAAVSETAKIRLQEWNRAGGNIIAMRTANNWLNSQKIINLSIKQPASTDVSENIPYYLMREFRGARSIPGTIFEHKIDITHPIGFGYKRNTLPIFKTGSMAIERGQNPWSYPVRCSQNPLLSGYVHPILLEPLKGSASVIINSPGRGIIISLIDNPNYRAFWYGTNKLFMNAIFFGSIMRI